jgi:hypothetical protein
MNVILQRAPLLVIVAAAIVVTTVSLCLSAMS